MAIWSKTLGADDHRRQGNKLLADGDLAGAEACYRRAVAVDPRSVDAQTALGFVLLRQGQLAAAKGPLERALALAPREADLHYLLGTIARKEQALEEAAGCLRRAIELRPDFAEAWHELGLVLRGNRNFDDALRAFERVIALQPGFAAARLNKGLVHLLRGEFAPGLELLESRLEAEHSAALANWLALLGGRPALVRWRGEPLRGRRLLLWVEEGAGDCIMVMRYLTLLAARGANAVVVLSDPSLARILRAFPVVGQVPTRVDEVPLDALEVHCPMMSLPYVWGTRADTIPDSVPYIAVPPALQNEWAQQLAHLARPRVGLVWAGSAHYGSDAIRSIAPHRLRPLARAHASFVNLQKGARAAELAEIGAPVCDPMPQCADYLDTAAVVANLDLVISVDTSVAHLAGALGKQVWLLNRYESEWRWQLGREDSPWYPTMRIFTQRQRGDWDDVVQRVAAALPRPG